MIYFGIDPGPVTSTAVAFDGQRVTKVLELPPVELALAIEFDQVACEWVECFGMAVGKEVFQTVYNIGLLAGCMRDMRLIPRRDVKLNLCRSSRAKDGNVRQALIDRLGPVGTKKAPGPCYGVSGHAWAALAVAVTAFDCPMTEHEATFHLTTNQPSEVA